MESGDSFSIIELFSGIGGMHAAVKETGLPFKVVGSYEINPSALAVYQHNFGTTKTTERNIMGLNIKTLEDLKPNLLVMSPPCQPFTRQGLKKDVEDKRCSPFLHVLSLLNDAKTVPKIILVENVAGFESSLAHTKLIDVLNKRGYVYQEFLLTPLELGIPNSRLRYYIVALLPPHSFCFETSDKILSTMPICICYHSECLTEVEDYCKLCCKPIHRDVSKIIFNKFSTWHSTSLHPKVFSLGEFGLTLSPFLDTLDDPRPYLVKKRDLVKYAQVFDIVSPSSRSSCCFTRGYGHYMQGTGSVIHHNQSINMDDVYRSIEFLDVTDPQYEELLSSLQLRYFTPKEILKLMCFPDYFELPPSFTPKQAYKMLGNSINVLVVTILLTTVLKN